MPMITSRILDTQSASKTYVPVPSKSHLVSYDDCFLHSPETSVLPTSKASAKTIPSSIRIAGQEDFDWRTNRNAYQRIIHLRTLQSNWDGYGAPTFSRQQIRRALDVYSSIFGFLIDHRLNTAQSEPFVSPGSNGSVLFDWSEKRFPDHQLEIEVPANSTSELMYLKSSRDSDDEGRIDKTEIKALLSWLFQIK